MRNEPHSRPDYLAIGHISKDKVQGGYAAGGSVLYAALTAQKLGLQAAMVTAYAPEDDEMLDPARDLGVWIHEVASASTTTFQNVYDSAGKRMQVISTPAASLAYSDVPPAWLDAPIVHLAPVAQELPAPHREAFANRLLGVTPQGWLREWDDTGRVLHFAWPVPQALANLPAGAFLVLSLEDLGGDHKLMRHYMALAHLVAITHGSDVAYVSRDGKFVPVPTQPARPKDLTGAGDVFAAALFVRYHETGDAVEATRFAHAAAACSIEGQGQSAIPDRETVERRLGG